MLLKKSLVFFFIFFAWGWGSISVFASTSTIKTRSVMLRDLYEMTHLSRKFFSSFSFCDVPTKFPEFKRQAFQVKINKPLCLSTSFQGLQMKPKSLMNKKHDFFSVRKMSFLSDVFLASSSRYYSKKSRSEDDYEEIMYDKSEGELGAVNFKDLSFARNAEVVILEDANFSLSPGEKIVLVGENGVGKSTVLRLIAGEISPDSGKIVAKGKIGYLPQNPRLINIKNIRDCFIYYLGDPLLSSFLGKDSSLISSTLLQEFNRKGGYLFSKTLRNLDMGTYSLDFPFHDLSGGQKTKVILSAIFSVGFDLLLFDEPTNHLDEKSCKWLENALKNYYGAWIVVSHDRMLINNTANAMLELTPDNHKLQKFRGGYSFYLTEKQKEYERKKQLFERQQKERAFLEVRLKDNKEASPQKVRRRDNDKLGFNARGDGKQKSQKRVINQLHEKIERIEEQTVLIPYKRKVISPDFSENYQGDELSLQVTDLTIGIGDRVLLDKLSFSVLNGEKLIITGKNGSGKTTLLKTIIGQLSSKKGSIVTSTSVKFGYLDQEQESINPNLTLLEYYQENTHKSKEEICERLKKIGLFDPFEIGQKIATVSTGKQRKAQLACIMLQEANFLILDEPTNHIDLASIEQIESALIDFKGPIIAVSHDRWFIKKIATKKIDLTM
ncbi:MAG: ATP-binding cassette domain-containing protein [Alphaproteobacteria bacterium]|nr:ATP-binding cassette domain-containing protein [Silvanigrellaceae bacterium]MBX9787257.1 ATP-binding cassette domain-containing protein [Alphaproteobacteria bacterium]